MGTLEFSRSLVQEKGRLSHRFHAADQAINFEWQPVSKVKAYLTTPDGRYFLVKGRLWRCTNPNLPEAVERRLVQELMGAKRAIKAAKGDPQVSAPARVTRSRSRQSSHCLSRVRSADCRSAERILRKSSW